MMVLATLVLIVTMVYGALVKWVPQDQHELFFFNTLVASTAILIVFDPLRTRVEGALTRWMFQEKYELSRRVANLRADLMNVIDVRDLVPRVLSALEDSRRVTHAAIYIVDPDGSGYELAGHIGPRPEAPHRRRRPPDLPRAAAAGGGHLDRGARARDGGPAAQPERGAGEPVAHDPRARADQRLGGAGHRRRGAAAGHAGAARRAAARGPGGLLLGRDRAVPGGGGLDRRHPAELPALRADAGARAPGGAGADGGRPGPRDPQPARVDQGRGPGAAADRAGEPTTARSRSSSTSSSRRSTA